MSGSYDDAGGRIDYGTSQSSTRVRDVQGTEFLIRNNGMIEMVSTGRMWGPGNPAYLTIIANLSDVPGNREKLSSVLGTSAVAQAVATPRATSPSTALAVVPQAEPEKTGLAATAANPWFWPAVGIGVVGLVGAAIVFWPKGEK